MGSQHQGITILRREFFLHHRRPKNACGAKLGNFHKEIHTNTKKERQPWRKRVHIQTSVDRRSHVFNPIGNGERQFLNIRRRLPAYGSH